VFFFLAECEHPTRDHATSAGLTFPPFCLTVFSVWVSPPLNAAAAAAAVALEGILDGGGRPGHGWQLQAPAVPAGRQDGRQGRPRGRGHQNAVRPGSWMDRSARVLSRYMYAVGRHIYVHLQVWFLFMFMVHPAILRGFSVLNMLCLICSFFYFCLRAVTFFSSLHFSFYLFTSLFTLLLPFSYLLLLFIHVLCLFSIFSLLCFLLLPLFYFFCLLLLFAYFCFFFLPSACFFFTSFASFCVSLFCRNGCDAFC